MLAFVKFYLSSHVELQHRTDPGAPAEIMARITAVCEQRAVATSGGSKRLA
jgi:hypothetical protein